MPSYQFPLPDTHGWLVTWLVRLGRKAGLLAPAAATTRMNRRHRMMFAVDDRHARARGRHRPGFGPPVIAAVSQPTYFGAFCSALVAPGKRRHEQSARHAAERPARDTGLASRLLSAQRYLGLEQQHRERVRGCGLDDTDAATAVDARQRQIALLQRLGRIVR